MLSKFIICLTPFNIECCLTQTTRNGNMGMNGVYLDIYNKRNLFYFSLPVLCLSYSYNNTIYGLLFSGFTLALFTSSVYKWQHCLFFS